MRMRAGNIAVAAMCTAAAVVINIMSSLFPTARIAAAAVSGLATAVTLMKCGYLYSVLQFTAAAALALLLAPTKTGAILFSIFFGWYPIVKSLCERIKSPLLCWICKIIVFFIALSVAYYLWRNGFAGDIILPETALWLLALMGTAVFVIYDIGFSRLISLYQKRLHKGRDK